MSFKKIILLLISIFTIAVTCDSSELAKNYCIILDTSGSMQGSKIEIAKAALQEFVTLIPDGSNIGLILFKDGVAKEVASLKPKDEFQIPEISVGGSTPLTSSLRRAVNVLINQRKKQNGYGEYHAVVLTDGEDSEKGLRGSCTYALENKIVVYPIAFQLKKHEFNQFFQDTYNEAEDLRSLKKAFKAVVAEIAQSPSELFAGIPETADTDYIVLKNKKINKISKKADRNREKSAPVQKKKSNIFWIMASIAAAYIVYDVLIKRK